LSQAKGWRWIFWIVLILVCAIYSYVAPVVLTALIERNMCCTGFNILTGDPHGGISGGKDDSTPEGHRKLKFRARIDSGLSLKETCIKSYYTFNRLLVFPPKGFSDVRFLVLRLSHLSSPIYSASKKAAMV
jgi:hypothetical protein